MIKKGWDWNEIISTSLDEIPLVHYISSTKKKDVGELLSLFFGDNWKEDASSAWYTTIVSGECTPSLEDDDVDCECNCLDGDVVDHI